MVAYERTGSQCEWTPTRFIWPRSWDCSFVHLEYLHEILLGQEKLLYDPEVIGHNHLGVKGGGRCMSVKDNQILNNKR